jgi:hypothetical protein
MARPSLVAGILVLLAAVPASAHHGGIHPTFREERVYFHCTGPTKLYNANYWANESTTRWNTTAPSGSADDGAGCGGLEYGGYSNRAYDVAFQGSFTGNVRDVTVEIHQALLGKVRSATTESLRIFAWIDGLPLFPDGTQPEDGGTVVVTPITSPDGETEKFVFTITNIGVVKEIKDSQGEVVDVLTDGAALEDGQGNIEHDFLIYVGTHGDGMNTDVKTKLGAWAWDAIEVPSGITFNPSGPSAAKLKADMPTYT